MDKSIKEFFQQYTPLEFETNELIISAGDTPEGIYLLESGVVKMYMITNNGEEITVNLFKPNNFFPISWALDDNTPNQYYFQAIQPTRVWRAPPQETLKFLTDNPKHLLDLTARLFSGIWGLISQMQQLMHGKASDKVINTLLILTKRFGKKNGDEINISLALTHQDIASLSGTSRETVTRTITKLKQQKLVDIEHKHIKIFNLPKLQSIIS